MSHSRVILGLWPIAGITTVGVTEQDAVATVHAALDAGIDTFDTAMSYGYDGESDRILGRVLRERNADVSVISKVGQRWIGQQRVNDGRPPTLIADAETSLTRIGLESFDCMMLHTPDPDVPIERSAEALISLRDRGLCHRIGACNVTVEQWNRFQSVAASHALQCPLNLMQRDSLDQIIPTAADAGADVYVYWVLMKGLLAGRITRDHRFPDDDPRPSYEIFQGEFRRHAHDLIDELAKLARQWDRSVAQIAAGWAMSQPGVSAVLVGARRPEQIAELAETRPLEADLLAKLDQLAAGSAGDEQHDH